MTNSSRIEKGGIMLYRFTTKPIIISAPTEQEAWDEFFDNFDLDPENIDVEVECIGEE